MTDRAPPLSERESEIAALIADGFVTKQIADQLRISERRVLQYQTAIAFKVSGDHGRDDRVMIAKWWWAKAS